MVHFITKDLSVFNLKKFILIFFFYLFFLTPSYTYDESNSENFEQWLSSFKTFAIKKGVSKNTVELVLKNVKFLGLRRPETV